MDTSGRQSRPRAAFQRCAGAIFLIALILLALGGPAQAAPRALLVFDGKADSLGDGYLSARYIANLLGHFPIESEFLPLDKYRPGQLGAYDFVFFAPVATRPKFPAGFLDELTARQKP